VVGDRSWEKILTGFVWPFTHGKLKYFDRSEVDAAWKWLEEHDQATENDDRVFDMSEQPDKWGTYSWYWS